MTKEKLTNKKLGEVGFSRIFSFSNKIYNIVEVIYDPNIEFMWTWDSGICPQCKLKLTQTMKHVYYRIEVLLDEKVAENKATKDDVILLGDTLDGRKMIPSVDLRDEIFAKSKKFKNIK